MLETSGWKFCHFLTKLEAASWQPIKKWKLEARRGSQFVQPPQPWHFKFHMYCTQNVKISHFSNKMPSIPSNQQSEKIISQIGKKRFNYLKGKALTNEYSIPLWKNEVKTRSLSISKHKIRRSLLRHGQCPFSLLAKTQWRTIWSKIFAHQWRIDSPHKVTIKSIPREFHRVIKNNGDFLSEKETKEYIVRVLGRLPFSTLFLVTNYVIKCQRTQLPIYSTRQPCTIFLQPNLLHYQS